jgi:hypothetical protein
MALLVPNSYGSAADGRVLREYNPNHEPPGSTRGGGRFAPAPGGGASRAGETPRKIKKIELQGTLPGSPFNAAMAKKVLGRTMTETQVAQLAEDMLRDAEGVSFNVKVSTRRTVVYDNAGKSAEKEMVVIKFVGEDGDPTSHNPETHPTSLVRAFYRDGDKLIVQHSAFEKNRALPAGYGKDVLRSHMLTYEKLGVDRIETHANIDVGAYAWAKYGFAAANPGELGRDLEKLVDKWHGRTATDRDFATGSLKGGRGVAIDDSVAHELQRIAASPSKMKIWEFADLTIDGVKVGKTILTDVDQFDGWEAFLNVRGHDPFSVKQRQRFWGYVGRTKQPNVGGRPKTREAMVLLYKADRPAKPAGELCEWDGHRYSDRRMWDAMLNGDAAHFYELRDPAARAAYRGQLPQG